MNWYLQAKMVDKKDSLDEKSMHSQCSYCLRWATHPHNIKAEREEIVWKTYDRLDPEEKEGVDRVSKSISWVSHGVCSNCMEIIKKMKAKGINPYSFSPQYIKDLSLGLKSIA